MGAHNDHIGIRQGAPIDHDSLHLYAQAAYPIRERIALYNLENHICGGRQQTECSPATPAQQAHLDSLNAQIAAIHINLDSVRKANGGVRLDSISNGADDDGSGTVTLLEIAEKFAKSKPETKRSMLFVWHVGEEKGLWGSRVHHRSPARAARLDRRAAQHGHGGPRRGERSVRGRADLPAARRRAGACRRSSATSSRR